MWLLFDKEVYHSSTVANYGQLLEVTRSIMINHYNIEQICIKCRRWMGARALHINANRIDWKYHCGRVGECQCCSLSEEEESIKNSHPSSPSISQVPALLRIQQETHFRIKCIPWTRAWSGLNKGRTERCTCTMQITSTHRSYLKISFLKISFNKYFIWTAWKVLSVRIWTIWNKERYLYLSRMHF